MKKLQRYLGIAVVAFLVWLFVINQQDRFQNRPATHFTPLDNDGLSSLIEQSNPAYKILLRIDRFTSRCGTRIGTNNDCSKMELYPAPSEVAPIYSVFAARVPTMDKVWDDFLNDDSEQAGANYRAALEPIMPIMLKEWMIQWKWAVWIWHVIFALLMIFMLWKRRAVGSVITFLIIGPITLLSKAAKGAHEKV